MCFRQEADGKLYVHYQVLGRNHVAVPTHFFKVSLPVLLMMSSVSRTYLTNDDVTCLFPQLLILEQVDGSGVELRSYVLPNEPVDEKIPLERFLVPIETIERASGLLFVHNILKRSSNLRALTAK